VTALQLTGVTEQFLCCAKVFSYRYEGGCYYCGSKMGFFQATLDMCLQHAEVGD
jgi:UTP--glucose-1-phosphate uridylyltransferase